MVFYESLLVGWSLPSIREHTFCLQSGLGLLSYIVMWSNFIHTHACLSFPYAGIVDLGNCQPLTYEKALKLGVESRRLPIDIWTEWVLEALYCTHGVKWWNGYLFSSDMSIFFLLVHVLSKLVAIDCWSIANVTMIDNNRSWNTNRYSSQWIFSAVNLTIWLGYFILHR